MEGCIYQSIYVSRYKEDVWKAVSTYQFTSVSTWRVFERLYLLISSCLSAQGGCLEGCMHQFTSLHDARILVIGQRRHINMKHVFSLMSMETCGSQPIQP